MADRDIANKSPDYIRDIAHLLPAELTAFYVGIKGIIPAAVNVQGSASNAAALAANETTLWLLFGVAAILTILFYFIMPAMLTISSPSQRLLYCLTFVIWVLGIEVDRLGVIIEAKNYLGPTGTTVGRTLINLFVAIWSFAVPFIFRLINPPAVTSSSIQFDPPNQITGAPNQFSKFDTGSAITIKGSSSNNGSFTIQSVSPNGSTITTTPGVKTEASGANVTISSP